MVSYRIGIDVGGTFTHAVALESRGLEPAGQARVPTTHRAARGVAEGVIEALKVLLAEAGIEPQQVAFLAYSTTQVTNALLEGDVAPVGIISLGSGLEGRRAASQARLGAIPLAPGRALETFHRHLERGDLTAQTIDRALSDLAHEGAEVIVAAEAFSVDDPTGERIVVERARAADVPATGTHEVTGRYGLRVRTRTAAINASLLPKAIATADLTEAAAQEIGITAPLMVVRSDGGVMTVADMRRRPLLTLLSGPAAGVAAALMYARVSEGIFFEVGGTSTDISAIQHGRALLRSAEVGGHRLFLRTLDVRTVGVAGGSLPRLGEDDVRDVGPRSAHVAGLPYACFTEPAALGGKLKAVSLSPLPGDPSDYVAVELDSGERFAVTVTCAANAAGLVPEGDFALGRRASAEAALDPVGRMLDRSGREAAEMIVGAAAAKAGRMVTDVMDARGMDARLTEIIAGGGGAGALAPAVGRRVGAPVRIASNAPVISAIGTGLALVREVIERTVPEATEQDVLRIRREAVEAVVAQGADADSVSVEVEYDARAAVLRATASGQTELRERDAPEAGVGDEERRAAAAKSFGVAPDQVSLAAEAGLLSAYRGAWEEKRFFGLLARRRHGIAVLDRRGTVRLMLPGASAQQIGVARAGDELPRLLEGATRYGDAGAEMPQLFLGVRGRIVNLSGLPSAAQALSLAEAEIAGLADDEVILAVTAPRAG